jgi:hypothetical protein
LRQDHQQWCIGVWEVCRAQGMCGQGERAASVRKQANWGMYAWTGSS